MMAGMRRVLILGAAVALAGLSAQPASASTPPTPVVTSLSVTSGPTTGGNLVTVTGSGFTGLQEVDFGAVKATVVGTHTGTKVTVEAPPQAEDSIFVTVVGKVLRSTGGNLSKYTYVGLPHLTGVAPAALPTSGGAVTITGDHFFSLLAVWAHNDNTGVNTNVVYTVVSHTQIIATVPAGTGTVEMQVKTLYGTTPLNAFDHVTMLPAPQITSVYPASGPVTGGAWVILTGTGLGNVTSVTYGGVAAPFAVFCPPYPASCATSQLMLTISPPGTGLVNMQLHSPYGDSALTAASQYFYGPPTVLLVTPSSGSNTTRPIVYMLGTHFRNATAVHFGATLAPNYTWSVLNDNIIEIFGAPSGSGTVDVTVSGPGGTSANERGRPLHVHAVTITPRARRGRPPRA